MHLPFPDDKRNGEVELVAPTTAALRPKARIVFMMVKKIRM